MEIKGADIRTLLEMSRALILLAEVESEGNQ